MLARALTTKSYNTIIRYLAFTSALTLIALPITADRSTVGAANTKTIQGSVECSGANFSEPAGSPVGAGSVPIDVATGDFNLDGRPDFAVANDGADNLTIQLGNGNGGFTEPPDSPATVNPRSIAVGDFNLDGKPDLAVATFDGTNGLKILLGDGSGGFTPPAGPPAFAGFFCRAVEVGDFNRDGKADLAATNVFTDNVTILLGDGGGGFNTAVGSPVATGVFPDAVAVGDFNLDSKPDLAVANQGSNNVSILIGDGSGQFTPGSPVDAGAGPFWLATGDLDLDGNPDIAVANSDSNNLTILLGNGSGGFSEPSGSPITVGSAPRSVAVADFNLDGKPDIAVANFKSNNVTILSGDGSGGFSEPAGSPVGAGTNPNSLAVADFNLDGKPDLAVANLADDNVTILLNTCDAFPCDDIGFMEPKGSPASVGSLPFSIAVGDFNKDGRADLAVPSLDDHNVTILLGNGSGGFIQPAGSPVDVVSTPRSVAVGDFNQDGNADLAAANNGSPNVTILLGDGTGGFTQSAGPPPVAGANPTSVVVGDFNLDGKADLAVTNAGPDNVTTLLGDGTGAFTEAGGSPVAAGNTPVLSAIGDFNLDGKPDLAVTNLFSDNVTILLGNGTGGFTQPAGSPVSVGSGPFSLTVGDFNRDGKVDLAVPNENDNNVTILLGNGSGGFTQPAGSPVPVGSSPVSVGVGDFNLDGKPDLAVVNQVDSNVSIMLGDGSGGFTQSGGAPSDTGFLPFFVAVGEFNMDGKADLAVANGAGDNVTILLNTCTGPIADGCTLTCPGNISVSSVPNQCGAVVNYPAPTTSGNCGTVTCSPASGSFFPVGTTTVTCSASACDTVYAVAGNSLISFNPATPSAVSVPLPISDLGPNREVIAIDFRPATGQLYGLVTAPPSIGVVTIDLSNGQAIPVGNDFVVLGNSFGFDFDPTNDLLRITGVPFGDNITFDPDTGEIETQSLLNPDLPAVVGAAFNNNFAGAPSTTLYGIEARQDVLVIQNPPLASGTLTTVGPLGLDSETPVGFDISACGTAYASFGSFNNSDTGFYTMNLMTGAATLVGNIGGGGLAVRGIAVAPSSCAFTVTVNDTQPPSITCPANMTAVTNQVCTAPGGATCQVVTFPAPIAADNCPGVVVVCNPPSGSCFPTGTTTVTCTATDASGNTATCSFTVTTFDVALQDDSNPSTILLWNSTTGQYRFCCNGTTFTGVGKATIQGCVFTLQHIPADRRVLGRVDKAVHAGTASIQAPAGTTRCTITDRNTLNDTLFCQ